MNKLIRRISLKKITITVFFTLLTACSGQEPAVKQNVNSVSGDANKVLVDGKPRFVLGPVETIKLLDADLEFVSRVDTGARRTSIHAVDITVDESVKLEKGADVKGKAISFRVLTKNGISQRINTTMDKIIFVRTSEGGEYRYVVPLTFQWQDVTKKIQVTLNDRSRMTFRLLMGRNWITKDFVVNIDKKQPE